MQGMKRQLNRYIMGLTALLISASVIMAMTIPLYGSRVNAASPQQICEQSGGSYVHLTMDTFGCNCPPGARSFGGECTNLKELCTSSNGAWTDDSTNPNTGSCNCPSGTILQNNAKCVDANTGFRLNPAGECDAVAGDCITNDIQLALNILTAGVTIIIVIIIIIAGIQYMTSRDNPQAIQAAKAKIINAVIALIAFVFIYAFLQYIVPGGIF